MARARCPAGHGRFGLHAGSLLAGIEAVAQVPVVAIESVSKGRGVADTGGRVTHARVVADVQGRADHRRRHFQADSGGTGENAVAGVAVLTVPVHLAHGLAGALVALPVETQRRQAGVPFVARRKSAAGQGQTLVQRAGITVIADHVDTGLATRFGDTFLLAVAEVAVVAQGGGAHLAARHGIAGFGPVAGVAVIAFQGRMGAFAGERVAQIQGAGRTVVAQRDVVVATTRQFKESDPSGHEVQAYVPAFHVAFPLGGNPGQDFGQRQGDAAQRQGQIVGGGQYRGPGQEALHDPVLDPVVCVRRKRSHPAAHHVAGARGHHVGNHGAEVEGFGARGEAGRLHQGIGHAGGAVAVVDLRKGDLLSPGDQVALGGLVRFEQACALAELQARVGIAEVQGIENHHKAAMLEGVQGPGEIGDDQGRQVHGAETQVQGDGGLHVVNGLHAENAHDVFALAGAADAGIVHGVIKFVVTGGAVFLGRVGAGPGDGVAQVHGAGQAIAAFHGHARHAPARGEVAGLGPVAGIAIVAVDVTLTAPAVGYGDVDTAQFLVAGVIGAEIQVVAVQGDTAHAGPFHALIHGGALILVIAGGVVERVEAALERIAGIVGAGVSVVTESQGRHGEAAGHYVAVVGRAEVPVVAVQESTTHAGPGSADVTGGAGIAVVAGSPLIGGLTFALTVCRIAVQLQADIAGQRADHDGGGIHDARFLEAEQRPVAAISVFELQAIDIFLADALVLQTYALPPLAFVHQGAVVFIVAGCRVGRVRTAACRVAMVVGARVAVIADRVVHGEDATLHRVAGVQGAGIGVLAGQGIGTDALTVCAQVHLGADVLVVADIPLVGRLVHAFARFRGAGVFEAGIGTGWTGDLGAVLHFTEVVHAHEGAVAQVVVLLVLAVFVAGAGALVVQSNALTAGADVR